VSASGRPPTGDDRDAGAWGVALGYEDVSGAWRSAPRETVEWILDRMRARAGAAPAEGAAPLVLRPGDRLPAPGRWLVRLEDGGEAALEGRLPRNVPLGYHAAERLADGLRRPLIVSPGRCPLPAERSWGWAVQLYAAWSERSWGMGDLADLERLAGWGREQGARLMLVNPLGATTPGRPQEPSPYLPSSRCFLNPIYLRVEDVPGALEAGLDLERLARLGRALLGEPRIDRDRVWALKLEALERIWRSRRPPAGDDRAEAGGELLRSFAAFCALSERHAGAPWSSWPSEHRRPESPGVRAFAEEHRERVAFHVWLQRLTEDQLARAAGGVALVQDLPIGVDPAGADAWLWQDLFVLEARVGAPPDEFNTRGQDWGLPPLDPWRLREAAYEPFIRTVRAALRVGGGLRVDHVMGLFRLFWIPPGASPREGAYVAYPWRDLLDILALESARAGAFVVGEDLGTVERFMRAELRARRVLSYRLLWFESGTPRRFPRRALAAVTTHDLPTVAGLWTGADLEEQRRLGLAPNERSVAEIRARLAAWGGLADDAPAAAAVEAAYRLLAAAPSLARLAALEDALLVEQRPNIPGTTRERPNWSRLLPRSLEDLERAPCALAIARALAEAPGPAVSGRPGAGR
jgi:4-alpha-glucanotransferase